MSRIGKLPIAVPSGVDVAIDQSLVTVKGPKGTLSHTIAAPITIAKGEDGVLEVQRPDDERTSRSLILTDAEADDLVTRVARVLNAG